MIRRTIAAAPHAPRLLAWRGAGRGLGWLALIGLLGSASFAAAQQETAVSDSRSQAAADKKQPALVPVITLRGAVTESPQAADNPLAGSVSVSFRSLLEKFEKLQKDPNVAGVVVLLEGASIGTGQVEELRRAMDEVVAAGKPIFTHVDSLGTASLALLSGASHLSVTPTGDLFINGMYGESPYLREMLRMIHVEPDFLSCGPYKSAGEMFTRNEPSEEAQENLDWLLDSMFQQRLEMIARGRKVSVDQVRQWIDRGLFDAESAVAAGVIDAAQHRQDFVAMLREKYGEDVNLARDYGRKKRTQIDLSSPFGLLQLYSEILSGGRPAKSTKDAVAVIHVEGAIMPGKGDANPLSLAGGGAFSTPIRKALDEAAEDDTVKAVVLRVDSPGGSAVASEIILDATRRVRAKKPLVVSMGNVAGSGGYYVACGADTIFADSGTITGSIGVVSGKLATRKMWDSIGVNWHTTKRGANAGMLDSSDPFTAEQRQQLQSWMDTVYEVFKGHVTAIRGERLKKPIDELAGGRVYTGAQALELGLIDRIGGLREAIAFVAAEAGLQDYEVRDLPEPKNFLEELLAELAGEEVEDARLSLPGSGSVSLWEALQPYLKGLEGRRLKQVLAAVQQLQLLQQEQVLLTAPLIEIR